MGGYIMRRKTSFLFVMVLLMCIGFAAITTNVIVNNTARIGVSDLDVYFGNVSVYNPDSHFANGNVDLSSDKKSITFTTDNLSEENPRFALMYSINNSSSNYDADIEFNYDVQSDIENIDEYLDFYFYNMTNDRKWENQNTYLLQAGEKNNFAFMVSLNKPMLEEKSISVTITYDAKAIERETIVEAGGQKEVDSYFDLEPGLYSLDKKQTKSWDDLLNENIITVTDGKLSTSLGDPKTILGEIDPNATSQIPHNDISNQDMYNLITSSNESCKSLDGLLVLDESVKSVEEVNLVCKELKGIVIKSNDLSKVDKMLFGILPTKVLYMNTDSNPDLTRISNTDLISSGVLALNPVIKGEWAVSPSDSGKGIAYLGDDKEITVPNYITSLEGKPFLLNYATKVTLPSAVSEIGEEAFDGIDEVYYDGPATYKDYDKFWGAKRLNPVIDGDFVYSGSDKKILAEYIGESKDIVIPEGVEEISSYCFKEKELDSLVLPSSLEKIGYGAFEGNGLETVTIPSGVEYIGQDAFCGTKKIIYDGIAIFNDNQYWGAESAETYTDGDFIYLGPSKQNLIEYNGEDEDVIIPEGVKTINDYVFDGKTLNSIQLPSSLVFIGYESFQSSDLKVINVPSSVTFIGYDAFCGIDVVNYNGSATYDEEDSKYWGAKILNPIIEDGYVYSQDRKTLLSYTGDSTDIVIPEGVEVIGEECFEYKAITSISFSSTVKEIEDYAFNNADIEILTIPSTVEDIGYNAFKNIVSIIYEGSATYSSSNKYWGAKSLNSIIDGDYIYSTDYKTIFGYVGSSKDIVIPDGIITIGKEAFKSISLSSVTIPESVTTIEDSAFANTGLNEINVPNTVTNIGTSAFKNIMIVKYKGSATYSSNDKYWGAKYMNCDLSDLFVISDDGLTLIKYIGSSYDVTIPNGIKVIGDRAFQSKSCYNVVIPEGVEKIGEYAFANTSNSSITVPSTVNEIGYHAFYHRSNVVYKGPATYSEDDDDAWGAQMLNGGYREGDLVYSDSTKKKVVDTYSTSGNIIIPDSVEVVGYRAFASTEYNSITLPLELKKIEEEAFDWCKLNDVLVVPSDVESIEKYAFEDVRAVEYHGSLTDSSNWGATAFNAYIEDYSAYNDSSKTKLLSYFGNNTSYTFFDAVTAIGKRAFFNQNIPELIIPDTITSIEYAAFEFSDINKIVLPNSINTIDGYMLTFCYAKEIVLPNNLLKIEDGAFNYTKTEKITLPASVNYIGTNLFVTSNNVSSVTFENTEGWSVKNGNEVIKIDSTQLADPTSAFNLLKTTYKDYTWSRE
jgi:hypothetical protein